MNKFGLTLISTIGITLNPWRVGSAQSSRTPFQITVTRTAQGVELRCARGCAWKTAAVTCDAPPASRGDSARLVLHKPTEPLLIIDGVPAAAGEGPSGCGVELNERGVRAAPDASRYLQLTVF